MTTKSMPIKTYSNLNDWWDDLSLYNKAKIYISCNKSLYINNWNNLTEEEQKIMLEK